MSWKRSMELMKQSHESQSAPVPHCPYCGSTSITVVKKGFGMGKALTGAAFLGVPGLIAGGLGANKIKRVCLNCGRKF